MPFVWHDLAVVRQISDRVAVMREDRIIESGDAVTLFATPRQAYAAELLASISDPFGGRPFATGPAGPSEGGTSWPIDVDPLEPPGP